jgi:hypothetical protein
MDQWEDTSDQHIDEWEDTSDKHIDEETIGIHSLPLPTGFQHIPTLVTIPRAADIVSITSRSQQH